MKKLVRIILTSLILSLAVSSAVFADVISDAPFEDGSTVQETSAPPAAVKAAAETQAAAQQDTAVLGSAPDATGNANASAQAPAAAKNETITAAPVAQENCDAGSGSAGPQPIAAASAGTIGPGGAMIVKSGTGSGTAVSGSTVPGADYANAATVRMDLGFTVVSPNHSSGGFMVAEGSVQLANGSWESIGYDKHIRQPYFKLIREEGEWYVVAVNASRIGDYRTSDGSVVKELWLKKSDCVARNYIELNTSNATRQQIVKTALSLLGKGYQYAGNGPDAFDCSGFVNMVMSTAGVSVPRTSSELCRTGTQVGIGGLRPGDIVGRPGHVGIYIGGGYFIHAAESSTGVVTESIEIYNRASAFSSYTNVIGD